MMRTGGSIVVAILLGSGAARAQQPNDPFDRPAPGQTPMPADPWPRLTEEELGLVPPRPPPPSESAPQPVGDPPSPPFGSPGQLVVTADSIVALAWTTYSPSRDDLSSFAVTFSPGVDVFVMRGFSVGGEFHVGYATSSEYDTESKLVRSKSTTLAGGPRVGFNVPLGAALSWYPRVTLGVESVRREERRVARASTFGPEPGGTGSELGVFVGVFAPVLVHPKPHLFLGLGPAVVHVLGVSREGPEIGAERTTLAARFVVGGWWGGAKVSSDAARLAPSPQFGASGQWVFTGEIGAAAARTASDGASSPSTVATFAPGVDYFVGRRISVGASIALSRSRIFGVTLDGVPRESEASMLGGTLRVGVDVPFTSWLSFYPRAFASFGGGWYARRLGSGRSELTDVFITPGAYAPLLVHPASHVFVGLGPSLSYDALRVTEPGANRRATRVGAALLVGGWL
ncbi:MAG: hypothetical protein KF819_00635 [Labilithrix sp.]|nr:hypothetical protein [Labilithrix sp.]